MTISELGQVALPDNIVNKLLQATEAYAELNTLQRIYPDMCTVATNLLTICDVYYRAINIGNNIELNSVIQDSFTSDSRSDINLFMQSYQSCKAYAHEKKAEAGVLTAVDIVRINDALLSLDIGILSKQDVFFDYMPCIEPFWMILHELYNPKPQYHILLEVAIALARFMSFAGDEKLCLSTLNIFLSVVFENNSAFEGLIMQWTLLTNPRKAFSEIDDENKLIHVLTVFEKMWRLQSSLFYRLADIKTVILRKLQADCPTLASPQITQLLANMICLRISDLQSNLNVSSKTAIGYLKMLEQGGILHSIKVGRDRFCFNTIYCFMLQDLI